jgi:predicted dehydrogenase
VKELRFAQIGSGLMGKAYGLALADLPMCFWPPPLMPRRTLLADVTEELARDNAARFGYERWAVGWEAAVSDPDVEAVCIITPNSLHRDIVIAAAQAGKHITCEKPLAMNSRQAKEMYDAVQRAGVTHQTGFNWRFAPAVQMAKKMIADGELGRIYDFHGWWLADWPMDPDIPLTWRFQKVLSGGGALADIGSHAIDLGRFLVGEIVEVCGLMDTYIKRRAIVDPFAPPASVVTGDRSKIQYGDVDVDDNAAFICKFESGAFGQFSASHFSAGRKHSYGFELHAERGTLFFDWRHMNELQFYSREDPADHEGFRTIIMGPRHPFGEAFWPVQGYGIGYTETKILQMNDFVGAVARKTKPQTDFYDGWKAQQIGDAVVASVREHGWIKVAEI